MEKKTITKICVSALILIVAVVFACAIGQGGRVTYQKPSPYAAEAKNDYSTVQVEMTVQEGKINDCAIKSSGDNDLLTDDLRAEWAQSIVDNQSYENDAISGATLVYSAASVKEAAKDIFTQAGLPIPEPAATPEPEVEAEAPAGADETGADTYAVEKTTDFSTIKVALTVEDGKVTAADITSEGANDLLTDEIRDTWEAQIVEKQSIDAVSGVTISSDAVQEAITQLLPEGAEAAGLTDGTYSVEKTTDFSTIKVEMTVEGGKVTAADIASEGANDLLTDEHRDTWEAQIVDKQGVDAVSGVTISSNAVQEAVDELLAQAAGGAETAADDGKIAELEAALADAETRAEAAEARLAEAEAKVAELEAAAEAAATAETVEAAPQAEASDLVDGTYAVRKTTDFSDIDVAITVLDGKLTQAVVSSEGANDLLTDEQRSAWADQIVENQAVDAVSGVTISSNAVQEAVDELLARAKGEQAEAEAEASDLIDGTYALRKTTDFSTIDVAITVLDGKLTQAVVYSEGENDLLTDEQRSAWADQIVENQAVDAVSGVTISSNAVQEAVAELLARAKGEQAEGEAEAGAAEAKAEAPAESGSADASRFMRPRPVFETAPAEASEADEASDLIDGTYALRKTTDFSTIDVAITVLDGKLTQAVVYSEGENDLLTDEQRSAWADQIVKDQAVDTISGATISSNAVQEAVAELLARAKGEQAEGEAEAGAAEAKAEAPAESADASRFMRPRPVFETEPTEASEADEAPEAEALVESGSADASRFMRPRPVFSSESTEVESGEPAAEMTEEERLTAILPSIVTTMGDNRENSYVIDYLEQDPYLVNIYEGYGFAKDYGSARGHEYTLEDVAKTQRPHPKANCITCKTPDLHKMIEEQGVAVYSMPFDEVFPQMTNNVSCYTCHGDDMGNGGTLQVTHQYVNEALGENVSAIKPATLSCGQCHIEYYFTPSDSEAMMPYHSVEQMTPEAILAYYDDMGFADWTQESTGTPLLKAQHPEMETVLQGKHTAFLSCADCHMPAETTEAGVEYRSHYLVSPLENEALLASCAQCHGDTDMTAFVKDIQDKVTARETEVGNALSGMKDALAAAVASGDWSEDDLNAVRKLHREAQWFFDYCYVENSEGAHNSELSMNCLNTAEAKIKEAMGLLEKTAA